MKKALTKIEAVKNWCKKSSAEIINKLQLIMKAEDFLMGNIIYVLIFGRRFPFNIKETYLFNV